MAITLILRIVKKYLQLSHIDLFGLNKQLKVHFVKLSLSMMSKSVEHIEIVIDKSHIRTYEGVLCLTATLSVPDNKSDDEWCCRLERLVNSQKQAGGHCIGSTGHAVILISEKSK
ncbi:MAG: hypothetical protein WBM78_18785 [Desulfobacterales bacterium]